MILYHNWLNDVIYLFYTLCIDFPCLNSYIYIPLTKQEFLFIQMLHL